jgi:acyl carrier protein
MRRERHDILRRRYIMHSPGSGAPVDPSTTRAHIVEEIRTFISEEILLGQAEELSGATPLLELGILDSFALLKVLAHLNDRYGVEIRPEQIDGRDFAAVDAIANLVVGRRASGRRRAQAVAVSRPEGVVVFEAPECSQVFVLFLGQTLNLDAKADLEFFKDGGLEDRNILIFDDPYVESYRSGVSPSLPTPAAICEWCRHWIAERPHLEHVYCIGVSAGGPMALVAGHSLGAEMVWAFAPRPIRARLGRPPGPEIVQFVRRVTGKSIAELRTGMTDRDREQIDANITPELVSSYYRNLADPQRVLDLDHLASLVRTLSAGNGVTQYRLVRVPRDECDSYVVDALRHCPGVSTIDVEPSESDPPEWAFSRWIPPAGWVCRNHLVIGILQRRGQLSTLFPEFLAATSSV